MPGFPGLRLWFAILAFLFAAVTVWIAGFKITRCANIISHRTGVGQALIGLLLLGGVTSLPKLAVAITSSVSGDAALAVNSVIGGIAMQVAILALANALIGRSALTHVLPDPIVILQGGFKILRLSIVTVAIVVGDTPILWTGLWLWLLAIVMGVAMWYSLRWKASCRVESMTAKTRRRRRIIARGRPHRRIKTRR
ncbi:hypothetical protein [Aquibium oceanicum]|uniref:hypothetical protein n=1 Tax=Aquibium oceanicum TaxID=1670800 RepID=UPI000A5F454C|nr:hypothetical protein [Aquibium oceanicum]